MEEITAWLLRRLALRNFSGSRGRLFEKLFLAVDQGIDVVSSQLKPVAVRNRIRGARFDAIAAENAARIIYVVDARIALASGNAIGVGIFSGLDVDAVCRTRRGTEKASHAFLKTGFIAVQDMDSAVARLKVNLFVGIILRDCFAKHVAKCHAKPLHQRGEGLADFS